MKKGSSYFSFFQKVKLRRAPAGLERPRSEDQVPPSPLGNKYRVLRLPDHRSCKVLTASASPVGADVRPATARTPVATRGAPPLVIAGGHDLVAGGVEVRQVGAVSGLEELRVQSVGGEDLAVSELLRSTLHLFAHVVHRTSVLGLPVSRKVDVDAEDTERVLAGVHGEPTDVVPLGEAVATPEVGLLALDDGDPVLEGLLVRAELHVQDLEILDPLDVIARRIDGSEHVLGNDPVPVLLVVLAEQRELRFE